MKNIKSNIIKNIFGFLFFLMGPMQVGALGSCPSCPAPGPGLSLKCMLKTSVKYLIRVGVFSLMETFFNRIDMND